MTRPVVIALAAAGSLAAAASAAAGASTALAAATPLVAANLSGPGARALARAPKQVVYTEDGSGFLAGRGRSARSPGRLRWLATTSSQARASGADWFDNCRPSCATGTFRAYPATLRLYRPAVLGGHLVFTRMTVTYTGARPPYPAAGDGSWTASLRYSAHLYFWSR